MIISPGTGFATATRSGPRSRLTRLASASPLRLVAPNNHGSAAWVVGVSFGGGLVGRDRIELELAVDEGAALYATTQASTKVYRGARAQQATRADVREGGLLVSLPDPVVAFAGAAYAQESRVSVAEGGSLVWADAFTAGRVASGERWRFARVSSRTRIFVGEALAFADGLELAPADVPVESAGWDAMATLVALGPRAASVVEHALATRGRRDERAAWSVSPLERAGARGCVVRLVARDAEALAARTRSLLRNLPETLGDDPFVRKW